jgi:hypothetical protein
LCLRKRREQRARQPTRRRWQRRAADERYRAHQREKRAGAVAAVLRVDRATLDLDGARGLDTATDALRTPGDFDARINALRERLDLYGALAGDAAVPAPRSKRSFFDRR